MNASKAIIAIGVTILLCSALFAQTNTCKFEVSSFQLNQQAKNFFIPALIFQPICYRFSAYQTEITYPLVFKSPVHYTAFFCKMEVKTANTLGIMIKLHAGDYDGYIGGYRILNPY